MICRGPLGKPVTLSRLALLALMGDGSDCSGRRAVSPASRSVGKACGRTRALLRFGLNPLSFCTATGALLKKLRLTRDLSLRSRRICAEIRTMAMRAIKAVNAIVTTHDVVHQYSLATENGSAITYTKPANSTRTRFLSLISRSWPDLGPCWP